MPKYTTKNCKKHGETEFVLEGRGYYRCKKCRSENVKKRRDKVKGLLVEEFGGECKLCGYDKCQGALQFHHLDPTTKSFGIAEKGRTLAFNRLKEEANKCVLLCANCHAEVEAGVTTVQVALDTCARPHASHL